MIQLPRRVGLSLLLTSALVVSAPATVRSQDSLLITNANIVDVVRGSTHPGSVLLAGGRIASILDSAVPGWQGEVLDLAGRYLMPGLIDAHVHLDDATPLKALSRGATTLRSMGSAFFLDVALRDSARQAGGRLPEILAAGYHVLDRISSDLPIDAPELEDLVATGVRTPGAAARVTEVQLAHGVDWIKTGGDRILVAAPDPGIWSRRWDRFLVWLGLRDPSDSRALEEFTQTPVLEPLLTAAQFDTIVALASAAGRKVASHSYSDSTAARAARAGVATVEHGQWLHRPTLELMARQQVALVPTVAMAEQRGHVHLNRLRALIRESDELGITILAGSDSRYRDELDIVWEVRALERAGLDRRLALAAATATAARVLGIGDRTGSIEVGLEADLLVLEGNPLEDLAALERPWLVINDGLVLRPSELHAEHPLESDP